MGNKSLVKRSVLQLQRDFGNVIPIEEIIKVNPEVSEEEVMQALDELKGEEISVHFADKVIYGKALGINPDGALKVLHENKEIVCHSGDVSIRRNK